MNKGKITTLEDSDNKIELNMLFNSFESSEKNIIFEIIKLMANSFEIFYESLSNCAGLNLNRSKYAKYLFLNENINEEFDRKNFNDNYPSTDIFFPQAIFRYDLENLIRRINSNTSNRSIDNSNSIKNSIFRIVHRFVLSLDSEFNYQHRFYFAEKTVTDNIVPENIRHLIRQHNADLIDNLYEKLIGYDKEHIILTDLFDKKEIYKGRVMGDRCLGLKLKELKQNKLNLDKKAEIEAGFRPDENPCDYTKDSNHLREMNFRKCFEDKSGLNYLSEGYCDYFNEMYRVHIEKLPPSNSEAVITKDVESKDVESNFNQKEDLINYVNFYEADKIPTLLHNAPFNSENVMRKVISYDQKDRECVSSYTADTSSITKIFLLIFPVVLLSYFIYIVIKRRQNLNK
ncbi:hypothetical protein NBO_32g0039 [Nosema bombycis CQ1]|uniref:Uncharacterized protein n=1 Tax=Nosema bombycis (strain CQ1 / CVCC 102059) TaxID=578461 RepID=R0M8G4_NOSB1|nr:hypothetical protein NBO_32g0039 [Nosema bombycis CQ1]|eukprot:EOB14264.1 hypothetical protein NBO_32g0039 [Nosema bombycis CQ1]